MVFRVNSNFFHLVFFSILLLKTCRNFGQEQVKRKLTEADYGTFGSLHLKSFSTDGKWVSFEMHYENEKDTLFLQNTVSGQITTMPGGKDASFGGGLFFAYRQSNNLIVKNLKTRLSETLENVVKYEFLSDGKYLLSQQQDSTLTIRNIKQKFTTSIDKVLGYKTNEHPKAVLYTRRNNGKYALECFSLESFKNTILFQNELPISRMTWQKSGDALSFMCGNELKYFDLRTRNLYSLNLCADEFNLKVVEGVQYPIVVADDGEKVFFSVASDKPKLAETKRQITEVWNGNDVCLFPVRQVLENINMPLLAVWQPRKGTFKVLSDDLRYFSRLTGNKDYVVLSDPYRYGLEPTYYEKVDYYIKDVRTGAEKLLLEKQSHDPMLLSFSPLTNEMVYYRDKQWWYYNPDTDITRCLTAKLTSIWDNTSDDVPHQFRVYGVAGWSADGKSVLIYNRHTVWKVALNSSKFLKLTHGEDNENVCRISNLNFNDISDSGYQKDNRRTIDLNKDIILEVVNQENWSKCFMLYSQNSGLQEIAFGKEYLTSIKNISKGKYVFISESYSQPAQLILVDKQHSKRVLYSSNKHKNYQERKSELITYKNRKGHLLKAALFYPDGYEKDKKYPMIVSIYDKKSISINRFSNPTFLNESGYSVANFTADGYFVLYPDIAYEMGNPGVSASDCVIAAVNAVIDTGMIESSRIGLIGHSFGGYETDFILTQTNLFTAAVSGAGVSDPIGRYFELGADYIHKDEMWRFETQQFRMGSSFFENKEGYLNNSALINADKINTPLLQWSGKDDVTVPFEQSVSLYMALRRLRKPTILLGYPNERHTLANPENQKDLTIRVKQWFDYYLKGKKEVGWISVGIE